MLSAVELIQLVMKKTGAETPTELARALRMTGYTAPRKITRWLNGESAPDYESTLELLAAAGMLDLDATAPASSGVDPTLQALQALDRRLDSDVIPRLDTIANNQRQARQERTTP